MMQTTGLLLVNGRWRDGGGSTFDSIDPASGDSLWQGKAANREDVHEAFTAARAAFDDWSDRAHGEREALLRAYARTLEQRKEALAALIAREVGKPLWEARTEVAAMIGKIELSIRAYGLRTGSTEAAGGHVLRHKPHGVVAVFGPYNFPGHLPNGHIVPALLAGNCVLFKPSEQTPAVGEAMVACWQAAGLPAAVLQLLQGERATGEALAAHQELDGLFFTGSSRTGAILHRQFAGMSEKILALELGGNNPLIVRPVENLDAAIHDVVQSAFLTSGQRCTCARRLIVPDDAFGRRFVARLSEVVEHLRIGAWNDEPQPFMGPVISAAVARQLLDTQAGLIGLGAKVVLPMRTLERGAAFVTPGLLDASDCEMPDEEHFGPLLKIIRVASLADAITVANRTRYGLSAGFIGDDEAEYRQYWRRSRAGIVNWNRPTTGASGAFPFGGIGASGNHRASAFYAADYCAYPVASGESAHPQLPEKLAPGLNL
ncbi:succinylglutamate-semialdehyde dehydrogenase [Solimonas terrae]|uniref:N-succinylglutamate 5-semialdehyde dehydrogenase n=1 Tax=Solimonas terrae TaxID=1396819 RepID=A0A6M2BU11_9GAMM|nr:succinylglutamate-semialdehyde dehydrogenase [Solimonas terrae]NGY05479.1 succinylglutamate-semialdehyde dehydrogenase [Solimonas terrae]